MMTRDEYAELHNHVFGKGTREDCQQGWQRWQAIWRSGLGLLVLHPPGEPAPAAQPTDIYLVAACEGLHFVARATEEHFRALPDRWQAFAAKLNLTTKAIGKKEISARSAARSFLTNGLIEGRCIDPERWGPAMAACIGWLVTSHHGSRILAHVGYRMLGYDIAYVASPPGRPAMFNFRSILAKQFDPTLALDSVRSLPLPAWQPPPH